MTHSNRTDMKPLAIVIPAYKARFLGRTLHHIAEQSCNDFTLYIGDDNSPENLKPIVEEYRDKIDIVYHRFEENMGGRDLTGHWERCIALSKEPLVWLFSDDDVMPKDGVERVLREYNNHKESTERLFMRLPLVVVDENEVVLHSNPPFDKPRISGYEFLLDKLSCKISSAAVEYIFSRDVLERCGGFVKFPVAWCSDDASWAKFATYTDGIISLSGEAVGWRNAQGENISNSTKYDSEKLDATAQFIRWIDFTFVKQMGADKALKKAIRRYAHTILTCSVRGNYSIRQLFTLCQSIATIDILSAVKTFTRHIRKRQ